MLRNNKNLIAYLFLVVFLDNIFYYKYTAENIFIRSLNIKNDKVSVRFSKWSRQTFVRQIINARSMLVFAYYYCPFLGSKNCQVDLLYFSSFFFIKSTINYSLLSTK